MRHISSITSFVSTEIKLFFYKKPHDTNIVGYYKNCQTMRIILEVSTRNTPIHKSIIPITRKITTNRDISSSCSWNGILSKKSHKVCNSELLRANTSAFTSLWSIDYSVFFSSVLNPIINSNHTNAIYSAYFFIF